MNTFAQILYGKAHWIFDSTETLAELRKRFAPDTVFVNITSLYPRPQEGWFYGAGEFTANNPNFSLAEAQQEKLNELNAAATAAYIGGFYSSATGTPLWYDSDQDTQNVLNRQYLIALSSPAIYSSTVFFTGLPAGVTPVRARPNKTDADSAKTVQLLDAAQMVKLGTDLAAAWSGVKSTLWALQGRLYVAMTRADVEAIIWPSGS